MLFKLSNLNSNLALTLGYLNLALNNSAQDYQNSFVPHPHGILQGLVKHLSKSPGFPGVHPYGK